MNKVTVELTQQEAETLLNLLAASWATNGLYGGQTLCDAANKLSLATLGFPWLIHFDTDRV